jgi:hypothetical protein
MLVMSRTETVDGELCDECIEEIGGRYTRSTAGLGWWGFMSACTTLFVLPSNLAEMRRLRRTPATPGRPDEADLARAEGWHEAALRSRKAVFWWVGAALAIVMLIFLFGLAVATSRPGDGNLKIALVVIGPLIGLPALILCLVAVTHGNAAARLRAQAERRFAAGGAPVR